MTFDDVDLATHGLIVRNTSLIPYMPMVGINHIEVGDKAHDFRAYLKPKIISVDVIVSSDTLESDLDDLSKILNPVLGLKELILDKPNDRYYLAKVSNGFGYQIVGSKVAIALIEFICPDPQAYDNDETSEDYDIDADPKTVEETVGGTGYAYPVYTLTAGENLTDVIVKLENVDTEEELVWEGSLADTKELVIDTVRWIVEKEGVADMTNVSGQFPRLLADQINDIKVTGFSTTGALNIAYRNRFL